MRKYGSQITKITTSGNYMKKIHINGDRKCLSSVSIISKYYIKILKVQSEFHVKRFM